MAQYYSFADAVSAVKRILNIDPGLNFLSAAAACVVVPNSDVALIGPDPKRSNVPIFPVLNNQVAKAGGAQVGATLCNGCVVEFGTVVTTGDSAILPASFPGMEIVVINAGANSMNIFPAVGESIDALGVNGAYALAVTATVKSVAFLCTKQGQWRSLKSA